jgi:hypothetical protein
MDQNEMSNLYRELSIDVPYQVSFHLAKWLQRNSCFRNPKAFDNKICKAVNLELLIINYPSKMEAGVIFLGKSASANLLKRIKLETNIITYLNVLI